MTRHSRTFSLALETALLVVLGLAGGRATHAQTTKPNPGPRLTWQERQFLVPIDRRLVTPFNSKANPGDRDTWYVLMFRDLAGVETRSQTTGGGYVTRSIEMQVAKADGAIVVHGRLEAALTVARFLTKSNTAAAELKVPAQSAGQRSQFATNKLWEYRSFASEDEAKLFLALIAPQKNQGPTK